MKVRHTFRIKPNIQQRAILEKEFGVARYAYNFGLNWWGKEFKSGSKPNYNKCSSAWTQERRSKEWALDSSCVPPQQALRHLQTAFKNFFDKRAKYPNFKKKHSKQSAEYTTSAFKYSAERKCITFAKVGEIFPNFSRDISGKPSTITITKSCSGKYFVSICVDELQKVQFKKTKLSVGVDMGINRLLTLSNGETVSNPKYTYKYSVKLARLQKALSRKTKGSNRMNKARLKVAKLHEKIGNSRKDALNKVTTNLVKRFDTIAIEDLNVRGMVKNRRLSRAISDCSFFQFKQMLEYKTEWYGKELIVIDRFFPSSKTCSNCGYIVESLPLQIREWNCIKCYARHDRDLNAAKNILAVGHTV